MEADLQEVYRIDLADYWRGELSLRRVSVLLRRLPPEAAVVRKAMDKDAVGWDIKAYLLADIFAAVTGEQHPARPNPEKKAKRTRAKRLAAQLAAQRERVEASKARGGEATQ